MNIKNLLALLLLLLCGCTLLNVSDDVVDGNDDRHDIYSIADPSILYNSMAVASVWDDWQVTYVDGQYIVATSKFGEVKNLWRTERFWDQPTGAHCTAFLVSSDIIATAGHCVNENNLGHKRFIFGFRMVDRYSPVTVFDYDQVYFGDRIISRVVDDMGADYAIIKLDRSVIGIDPLPLASNDVSAGDELYMVGHPSGLPLKVADNAEVIYVFAEYFASSLDTFGGNSGSPVFNSDHDVVGILARGGVDFIKDGPKYKTNVVGDGFGGSVVKVSVWDDFIK